MSALCAALRAQSDGVDEKRTRRPKHVALPPTGPSDKKSLHAAAARCLSGGLPPTQTPRLVPPARAASAGHEPQP
eukprot:8544040-Alexandrium_andersonii.AAC.1